jgi:hypothetical protein
MPLNATQWTKTRVFLDCSPLRPRDFPPPQTAPTVRFDRKIRHPEAFGRHRHKHPVASGVHLRGRSADKGALWVELEVLHAPGRPVHRLVRLRSADAPAGDAWILRCRIDSTTQAVRTFRVAPRELQEWRPADSQFGPNLCEVFSCTADRDRLEGVMTSASLILTLRVDRASGQGSWKTVGASGLKETNGALRRRAREAGPDAGVTPGPSAAPLPSGRRRPGPGAPGLPS